MENKFDLNGLHLTIVDDNEKFLDSMVNLFKEYCGEQYPNLEVLYFSGSDKYREYRNANKGKEAGNIIILGFTSPMSFWEYAEAQGRLEIVVMDHTFNNSKKDGNQWIEDFSKKFKERVEPIDFIMSTVRYDTDTVMKAILAGVSGYYCKDDGAKRLFEVIEQVRAGNPAIIEDVRQIFWKQNEDTNIVLSGMQKKVLGLAAAGMTSIEIAENLEISVATVNKTKREIYRKLGVKSEKGAILKYFKRLWLFSIESLIGEKVISGKVPGIQIIISSSGGKKRSIQLVYDVEINKNSILRNQNLNNALQLAISAINSEDIDQL